MGATPHTSVRRGKRVIITTRDGRRFLDKFVSKSGKGVALEAAGLVRGREIRAMTIYRGQDVPASGGRRND